MNKCQSLAQKYVARTTAAAALCASLFAGAAQAIVLDFESVATGGCQVTAGGSVAGFTLSPYNGTVGAGFNSSCSGIHSSAHSGSNYMLNFNSVLGQFTKDSGTFTLNSVWVQKDERVGSTTVRFQGWSGIGGSLLYTQDVSLGNNNWTQVSFSGWDNVKTFTWDSLIPGSSNIAIDDFEYNAAPVPEPLGLSLLGLGLLGLAAGRRRRRAAGA